MANLLFKRLLPVSSQTLYNWHASGGAFSRLAPPWQDIRITQWLGGERTRNQEPTTQFGDISKGAKVSLRSYLGPFYLTVLAQHDAHVLNSHFTDNMTRGPFSKWRHTHHFKTVSEDASILEDQIEYELPFPRVTQWANPIAEGELRRMFAFRHWRTHRDLLFHQSTSQQSSLKVLIAGESHLSYQFGALLKNGGHEPTFVRHRPTEMYAHVLWDELSLFESKGRPFDGVVFFGGFRGRSFNSRETRQRERLIKWMCAQQQRPQVWVATGQTEKSTELSVLEKNQIRGFFPSTGALFDAGHLLFPRQHFRQKKDICGEWCSLDDWLELILRSLFNGDFEGSLHALASEPLRRLSFKGSGLRVSNLPKPIPVQVANIMFPALFLEKGVHGVGRVKPYRMPDTIEESLSWEEKI